MKEPELRRHDVISQTITECLNAELDRCQQFAVELRQVNRSLSAEDARALLGEAADAIDTLVQVSLYYQEEKVATEIYRSLSARQEALGGEFEEVWDRNVDTLYEQ